MQAQLSLQARAMPLAPARRLASSRRSSPLAAAGKDEPAVRSGRTFSESTGEVTGPGADAPQQPLYVDQASLPKPDNLSKDMKKRLRQEYYGLGGAENQAMSSNYFLWIIVAISVLAVLSKLTGAI